MAAPKKQGLDYFPFEIGLLQDRKLRKLKMQYGTVATTTYLALLELIYGDKGYYLEYAENKDDVIWQILGIMQGRFQPTAETVSDVIDGLVDVQLFSADRYPKIITSKRVQQTYYSATVDRKAVEIDFEIWMLSEEEMRALSSKSFILQEFINRPNNGVNRPINGVNRPNYSQSKVKYDISHEACACTHEKNEEKVAFTDFLSAHPTIKNDLNGKIEIEIDWAALGKAIRESEWLKNCTSLKWLIDNYDKVLGGAYKTFKADKTGHFAGEREYAPGELNSLLKNVDDIDF
jgi:hypothetical protein